MANVFTIALKNFYGQKGCVGDLRLYQGHSQLTKAFVRLDKMSKKK